MENQLRWVAIVSLLFIVSVPFFEREMPPGLCKSLMIITIKGIRGKEKIAVKQYFE
jgi:hypothetical protein